MAIRALVREDGLNFVLFLVIDDIRGWGREGGTIWFSGVIGGC